MYPPWVIDMMHEHNVREAKRSLEAHVQFLEETKMSETEHDGKLDEYDDYRVTLDENRQVVVSDGHDAHIYLDAKQALSLLAWLEQEKGKLEQRAMEQG